MDWLHWLEDDKILKFNHTIDIVIVAFECMLYNKRGRSYNLTVRQMLYFFESQHYNMCNMGPETEPFTHQRKVQNIGNTIS